MLSTLRVHTQAETQSEGAVIWLEVCDERRLVQLRSFGAAVCLLEKGEDVREHLFQPILDDAHRLLAVLPVV